MRRAALRALGLAKAGHAAHLITATACRKRQPYTSRIVRCA